MLHYPVGMRVLAQPLPRQLQHYVRVVFGYNPAPDFVEKLRVKAANKK
jgi:hypothetical protein